MKNKKWIQCFITFVLVFAMLISPLQSITMQKVDASSKTQKSFYTGDDFEVTCTITDQWNTGFNANVTIKNTGKDTIDNWSIGFVFPYEISKIWNATIYLQEDSMYVIKNDISSQDIESNKSVSFGFTAKSTGDIKLPTQYVMLSKLVDVDKSDYKVSYNTTSDWKQAFNGELVVENISDSTIEDWTIEFDFPYQIDCFWEAKILSYKGNHYIVKNVGYNANIKAGEKIKLGFSAKPGNANSVPTNVSMDETCVDIYILGDDSDEDGLINTIELTIGTDPYKKDTDDDGLTDEYEYNDSHTDPLKKDTDGNRILDCDEDLDGDGLTILQELSYKTNNKNPDTDYDGINDFDEVMVYKSNPLVSDTDGDGINDGDEVKLQLNPNSKLTDGVLDSERCTEQKVPESAPQLTTLNSKENAYTISLDINAAGCAESNLSVDESNYEVAINSDAVLGAIPKLQYNEDMKVKGVRVNFHIKDEYIPKMDSAWPEELSGIKHFHIFKYFSNVNMILPVITEYDENSNTIYTDVDELGTYCVINLEKWFDELGITRDELYNQKSVDQVSINKMVSLEGKSIANESDSKVETEDIKQTKLSLMQNMNAMNDISKVGNEFIEFYTASDGLFTIGTVEGNPDLSSDNNQPLLFGHSLPESSFSTFKIDDTNIIFEGSNTNINEEDFSSKSTMTIDDVNIEQELKIVEGNAAGRKDVVRITYHVTNKADKAKNVGARIMLDTMLGESDETPFSVYGDDIFSETEYEGDDVPQVWHAFDSLTEPEIIAQGTIYKIPSMKPDIVQFTNWNRVKSTIWNYKTNSNREINDSAVAMTWKEKTLAPGESRDYTTYYGISDVNNDNSGDVSFGTILSNDKIEKISGVFTEINLSSFIENNGTEKITNTSLDIDIPKELELVTNQGTAESNHIEVGTIEPFQKSSTTFQLRVKNEYSNINTKSLEIAVHLKYTNESGIAKMEKTLINKFAVINTRNLMLFSVNMMPINLKDVLGRKVDSDGDGLTDEEELNSDYQLVTKNADGSYNLPTLQDCIDAENKDKEVKGGPVYCGFGTIFLAAPTIPNILLSARIYPACSSPCRVDTDNDGIWDVYEVKGKSSDSSTSIDIKLIDDSKCMSIDYTPYEDGDIYKEYSSKNHLGQLEIDKGGIIDDIPERYKNCYNFSRDFENKGMTQFIFKSEKNGVSDYKITLPYDTNLKLEVHKIYAGDQIVNFMGSELSDDKKKITYSYMLDDSAICLPSDIKYKIIVKNEGDYKPNCNIRIEQDNWLYAPYGAYREGYYDYRYGMSNDDVKQVYYSDKEIEMMYNIFYNDTNESVFKIRGYKGSDTLEYNDFLLNTLNAMKYQMSIQPDGYLEEDKFIGTIGIICTYGGGAIAITDNIAQKHIVRLSSSLILPAIAKISFVISVVGFAAQLYLALPRFSYEENLLDALEKGNCNVDYVLEVGSPTEWLPASDTYFVNKYKEDHQVRWNKIVIFSKPTIFDVDEGKIVDLK